MTLYVTFMCVQDISNRNTAWKNCNKGEIKLVYIHLKFHSKPLSLRKGLCTPRMFSCLKSTVPLNQPALRDSSSTKQKRVAVVFGFFCFIFMSLPPFLCLHTRNTQAIWHETWTELRSQEIQKEQRPKFSWCENKCYLSISSILLKEVTRSHHSLELFFMAWKPNAFIKVVILLTSLPTQKIKLYSNHIIVSH